MKTKELIQEIKALLNADQRARLAQRDSLEKVLGKLKEKESNLQQKLKAAGDDEDRRKELLRKLEVISAQSQKGLKLLAELEEIGSSLKSEGSDS